MSETTVNAYATKSDNTAATTPTPVAIVNDGTGDRQIVVLGKGDGTSGIVDGSSANPINVTLANTGANATAVKVDGSAVTQPVSGTVTANAGINLNTSALALETGGNLASAKTDLDTIVTNTNKIPALGQALAAASVPVILPSATVTTLTPPAAITNFANETGGNLAAIKADTDKIPSQGQALAASSMPVVLTAAQIAAMTLPTDGNGYVDVNIQTNSAGIANETGGNLATIATQTSGLSTSANQTNGTQRTGTSSAVVNVAQKTVNTTAVQLNASSTVPTNGIIVGALSTNSASIFIGGSGVTTSTGAELTPGSSLPFTANLNTLYIISVASTTDKIWYSVT